LSSLPAIGGPDVGRALARLDYWLETMRTTGGYGGPVSHWWESSLLYCGPMADWRYEGILAGYVTLYRTTGQAIWLERGIRAADDLTAAQLPAGTFRNSAFQQGPMEGGTPHEAAVVVALLELADLLRQLGDGHWSRYLDAARQNVEHYQIARLWNGRGFRDQPGTETLVPNKQGTAVEALVLYESLAQVDMSRYIDPAVRVVLDSQERHGPRAGATVHTGTGRHRLAIGIYTARSMCGLLRAHARHPGDRLLSAVRRAIPFLRGLMTPEGLAFGRYRDGSRISNPRFVAGAGDLLRLMVWGRSLGLATDADVATLVDILVRSQTPMGGIPTAIGFARRGARKPFAGPAEFRDVLPVVGWCDKVFRALSMVATPAPIEPSVVGAVEHSVDSTWKGRECVFREDATRMELLDARSRNPLFRWEKSACYPDTYRL
jgi:hypothetical protein